ncbi:MAG: 3-dehydroquinate synthase II, partial [Candidatus Bathyarchaeota archaeon]|nr:3-dehydroquinate synthase II [Candidatus Bathyarchaeota archaeon]
LGFTVASKDTNHEIVFLDKIDENLMISLKKRGKKVCLLVSITRGSDEESVVDAAEKNADYIIIQCLNWKVIPLENLIAKVHRRSKLLAEVSSVEEARLVMKTLEIGVDGLILKVNEPKILVDVAKIIEEEESGRLELNQAKITRCKELGLGDRVCIDTCELMSSGEGMLVGCQSAGLFLVQAEVFENPYVEPRPFRVNAGPVSLYLLTPENKTRYLSELKAGDEVLIVNRHGDFRVATIARVKIEKRPLMLIEAEVEGNTIKTIVQNAETIFLVTKDGSKSVRDIKPGDEVLVYLNPGGRHFGTLVKEESVIER